MDKSQACMYTYIFLPSIRINLSGDEEHDCVRFRDHIEITDLKKALQNMLAI